MGNWFTDTVGEVAGSGYDIVQTATGGDTRAQQEVQQQRQEAQAAAEREQQQLAQQQRGLETQGTDPASIQQHDNWEDWDHERLVSQLRDTLNLEKLNNSGAAWESLGKDIAETFADLDKETRAAAGDGMQGEAAEAGLNAAKPLQDWGQSFGDSVRGSGLKVQEAAVTADQTKQSMPPPTEHSTARTLLAAGTSVSTMGLTGLADAGTRMREANENEKRARAVAQNIYTPGYTQVDQSTPTLPPPVDPLNPPPPPPDQSGQGGIPAGQSPGGAGSGGGPAGVSPSGVGAGAGGAGVGSGSGGGVGGGGFGPNTPGGPAQSGSAWNNPPHGSGAGMHPGPGRPGAHDGAHGGGMAGGMVGGMAGAGAGGAAAAGAGGAGRAGAAGGGVGAGGRAGAGPVGAGAGAGAGSGAGAAGSGGAGARGGGAMGGGAGRGGGQGGEEDEHDRPSWLEEQDDVWLEDMPKTAPAVFGG